MIDIGSFPESPGVYIMKDTSGKILYVGKAKRLRRRIASYFREDQSRLTPKTRSLVGRVVQVDTLVTATEKEALLLEASLIKKHKPRYNIVLRDDKQYVLFRLNVQDDYPRLTITRRVRRDKALYYGPYTSALAARDTWKAIHHIFPLRRCKDSMFRNRVRPCLYHQIKQCLAPCVLKISVKEYWQMVRGVEMLLSGRTGELLSGMEREMRVASENMEYEQAAILRDRVRAVRKTVEGQVAVLQNEANLDALGLAEMEDGLALGLLFVRKGRLLDKKTFHWPGLGLEEGPEVLESFLGQYYGRYVHGDGGSGVDTGFIPDTVILPWVLESEETMTGLSDMLEEIKGRKVNVRKFSGGNEKRLIDMARINARQDALKREGGNHLPKLARPLGLSREPERVECVDVSHTGGKEMRVGMVVFEHGKPVKDAYRTYGIDEETSAGGDDYGALAAWARRRAEAGPPWADLLVVDGGRGQLAAVERGFVEQIGAPPCPMVGIAKMRESGGRVRRSHAALEDRLFVPGRKNELALAPGSPELLFLQRIRDAAHRYVISRHRRARGKSVLYSELESLPGIGPAIARKLWNHFSSPEEMAQATEEELASVPGVGRKRAKQFHELLQGMFSDR